MYKRTAFSTTHIHVVYNDIYSSYCYLTINPVTAMPVLRICNAFPTPLIIKKFNSWLNYWPSVKQLGSRQDTELLISAHALC